MSIRCSNCGYDLNRDDAHRCTQCGRVLIAASPASPRSGTASPAPVPYTSTVPAPPHTAGPALAPVSPGDWWSRTLTAWLRPPPQLEGRVLHISGPHKQRQGGWPGKWIKAALLSRISPFLGWIHIQSRMEVDVCHLRVLEIRSGRQRAATIVGSVSGDISVGDQVSLWGRVDGGTLFVNRAYNHETDAQIRVRP